MRFFAIALLMMVSIGAWADVKVIYGEKGTELQPDKDGKVTLGQKELTGGTVIISQEDQKDGTTKLTLAVTPDKGYRLAENGLEVYTVAPADISQTRTVKASTKLDIKSEDFKDEASKRTYTATIDSKLALWLKSATFALNESKGNRGVTLSSGYYYLENKQNENDEGYFLVPAGGTGSVKYFKDDEATPYLTTYKKSKETATDKIDNFVWYIEQVADGSDTYYRFRHMLTGKYVVANGVVDTKNPARLRLHLETQQNPDDNALFVIKRITNKDRIAIRHKSVFAVHTDGSVYWWWDVANGNKDNYSQSNSDGLLCFWNVLTDNPEKWNLPTAVDKTVCLPPVINYDASTQQVTISSYEGYSDVTFYYTTDGTEPTTSSTQYENPFTLASGVVKAIAVRSAFQNPTVTTYNTAQCAQPTVTLEDDGTYTLNCATGGVTYYYTTDGTLPTTASMSSTGTIDFTLDLDAQFLRVIAAKESDGSDASPVTLYYIPQCEKPTITNNSGTITISSATSGAELHYRKDGKEVTSSNDLYDGPYSYDITQDSHTITARAFKKGYGRSAQASYTYPKLATPVIKAVNADGSVKLTPNGATFYYKTSNTSTAPNDPKADQTELKPDETILLPAGTNTTIVKVRGYQLGYGYSDVLTYYVPTCDAPVIQQSGTTVTITCPNSSAKIYYSTSRDGEFTEYTNSFEKTADVPVVRAYTTCAGYLNSPIVILQDAQEVSSTDDMTEMSGSYKLSANFVVNNSIGTSAAPFTGTIDGQMNTITTTVTKPLVAYANGATIRNVIMEKVNIPSTTEDNVGAIVGNASGKCRIYNCGVLGTLTETKDANGDITNITSSSTIGGTGNVGSIVGQLNDNSRVINCYSYAEITGGNNVAGIVGYQSATVDLTQENISLLPMIVNCMFYGEISGGTTTAPVYGGRLIKNNGDKSVNLYNYFRSESLFDNSYTAIDQYKRSWPAEEKYLTRFEYYRSILNSNRHLCTFWVTDKRGTDQVASDTALIAKWVLDPSKAPYPILKKWGKYPSVINPDPIRTWRPRAKDEDGVVQEAQWVDRTSAKDYEGKKLGILKVTINAGAHHAGSVTSPITDKEFIIMDMDTLNYDYGYAKIQLPYYNELFGDPTADASQWDKRYGGNYKDYVVTGWDITDVTGGTDISDKAGTDADGVDYDHTFTADWESGYNFADRYCTVKDKFGVSGRVFAQGGYYYVPEGVEKITITAHWGTAVYVRNADNSVDRVNVTSDVGSGSEFTPAGKLPSPFQGQTVFTSIQNAIKSSSFSNLAAGKTVYDQAVVLVGNIQVRNGSTVVNNSGTNAVPYTLMSADFDLDNEPDFCLQLQFRNDLNRPRIQPVRFDFLSIPELGLAIRPDNKAWAIGIMVPAGHFEITETACMHTTQFEYDANITKVESPVILNGGHFEQVVVRYGSTSNNGISDRTSYFIMGGHFWMRRFTPGAHTNTGSTPKIRHCAVSVMGGEFPEFYLSGIYRTIVSNDDNPHCYINGGRFGTIAGAGMEQISGNITFKIDHAIIDEFYGGGINASLPVLGNIDVTIDHSRVGKYCGGPKVGILGTTSAYKTVTTHATGSTFNEYYGGGNGGTSYYREQKKDGDAAFPSQSASGWKDYGYSGFNPLNTISSVTKASDNSATNKGYHAEYEFEVFNNSNGTTDQAVVRAYYQWAQFGTTATGTVTNFLKDCTVNGNFYGGGNLGNVNGNVNTTLTGETHIVGSAFAAGYSAAIPKFRIHDKENATTSNFPARDFAGVITEHTLDYKKDDSGNEIYYTWSNELPPETTSDNAKNNPTFQKDGKWYCYTWESLKGLGTVNGNATLTIKGTTEIEGSVFGGGAQSAVSGNTTVTLSENAIVNGDVFGGGDEGVVEGSATVNIQE